MHIPHLGLAVALAGTAVHSAAAEQQVADASVHIKISSGTQLRGADADQDVKGWFSSGEQTCHVMDWYNWADFKYACQWNHGINGYNLFYERNDGGFVWECACDLHLGSYDPWDLSVWTWTGADGVACYTRDGKTYDQVIGEFSPVSCSERNIKNCDTQKPKCEKFPTGGDYLPDNDPRTAREVPLISASVVLESSSRSRD